MANGRPDEASDWDERNGQVRLAIVLERPGEYAKFIWGLEAKISERAIEGGGCPRCREVLRLQPRNNLIPLEL
jgi:hypothetical protein